MRPADPGDEDVALVLRGYETMLHGDFDGAVSVLHPDVEWVEPDTFPLGGTYHGPVAVADYLRASMAGWSELTSHRTPYRLGEDIVVVHHVTGKLADGTPHEAEVADVFTVRDGLVVRMHAYADPAEVPG